MKIQLLQKMQQLLWIRKVKGREGNIVKIYLKNIGKIREALVEINGITVIAGENNTGKSTIGKVLWSVFNGLFEFGSNNAKRKQNAIMDFLKKNALQELEGRVSRHKSLKVLRNVATQILKTIDGKQLDELEYEKIIRKMLSNEHYVLDDSLSRVEFAYLRHILSRDRKADIEEFLETVFESEFNGDILDSNIDDGSGSIQLSVKGNEVDFVVADDAVFCNKEVKDFYVSATYIDDPFAIDLLNEDPTFEETILTHKQDIFEKLKNVKKKKEYSLVKGYTKERLKHVDRILDEVCKGNIEGSNVTSYTYELNNGYPMDVRSLSTGLKSFVILKRLIQNDVIGINGTLILDEPEVHLHPKWQLKFAEAIVLLQKEFGLHILVNTHSPYFLEAIEVFASKHHIQDICKYYLATNDISGYGVVEDVENDIDKIYQLLAEPFQTLETERYSHD